VNVTNYLEGNLNLTLHCKSKQRDLGVQLLHHGASFGWNSGFDISERQYYCSFKWNSEPHFYDLNLASCNNPFNWYITKSGPCRVLSPSPADCDSWGI